MSTLSLKMTTKFCLKAFHTLQPHLSLLSHPFSYISHITKPSNTKISQNRDKLMECKTEETEQNSAVARLPLFSVPRKAMESPERSGILTPPIFTTASVPFRWEEEPGKPRFSGGSSSDGDRTSLELPPRLLLLQKLPRPECCSSFRMMDEKGSLFMRKRGWFGFGSWRRRDLGLRGKRDQVGVGGLVFPSSLDKETEISHSKVEITSFRRNGSFSSLSTQTRPHFWESVCEGLKHVVPWRSKRLKRERLS